MPTLSSALIPLGVKETGVAIQQVFNQVSDINREPSPNSSPPAPMKPRPLFQEMSCARTFENGSLPLIPLSISTLRLMLTTTALQRGAPKETHSQVGKHLTPCYGFTENVHISLPSRSHLSLTTSWFDSWLRKEYSQVRYSPSSYTSIELTEFDKLCDHPGPPIHV